ncbi:MAG: hypothetical protein ACKV2Q_03610 [Planctomycetaceae bacterium]
MRVGTTTEYDELLVRGIQTGLRKARELGYSVEVMDITASVSQGICHIHFAPLATPGFIISGGDLSLSVDPVTDELIGLQRGQ